MAGNKFDTGFAKYEVKKITIEHLGLYDTPTTFEGTIDQGMRYLSNLR